nr:hypothetical protein [Tanacetum cinerariifolium]
MAAEGNGDLPVPDLQTMEELCQPSLNGRGGPTAPIAIQEMNFGLKNDMIQQVQNSCQFHGLPGGTFMKRRPEECYDLIENMTTHHNDWDTSAQRSESSSSITSSSDTKIAALKAEMAEFNKNLMRVLKPPLAILKTYMLREPIKGNNQGRNQFFLGANQGQNQPPAYQAPVYQASVHQPLIPQPQVVTTNEFTNFMKANDAILKNMQTNMTSLKNSNLKLKNMFGQFMKIYTASSLGSRTLPGNTITNPKEDLKGITTRRGTAYPGPTIPTTSSSPIVERETEATKDTVHPTNNGSTEDVQPLVVLTQSPILNSEPVISPIIEPVASPVSAPKPNQRPLIPYPSRLQDQKLRDKANDQQEKFFQIFKDLNFNISFADALILMPKFGPSIKSLLTNKDKLCELARTPLNEHCSAVLLKKLPEKLRYPGKARRSFDFSSGWGCRICLRQSRRSFLKTGRALIDVFEGELTLRVRKEAITFNLGQTSRYSANYNDMTAKRIDVIDMACEEYSQEVLGFSDVIAKVELKDLPPHLEYAFLEGDDKLPVIIARDLSMEEKTALITVLKSH